MENAMLGPAGSSKERTLLFIDLEWAGGLGLTRYPLDLNKGAFHNGAEGGEFITKENDRKMVELWQ